MRSAFWFEDGGYGVVMMSVIAYHRPQILEARGLGRIGLERCRGLVRILRGKHRRIEQRLRDGAGDVVLVTPNTAAQSHDAAGLDLVLSGSIGCEFLIGRILTADVSSRIGCHVYTVLILTYSTALM